MGSPRTIKMCLLLSADINRQNKHRLKQTLPGGGGANRPRLSRNAMGKAATTHGDTRLGRSIFTANQVSREGNRCGTDSDCRSRGDPETTQIFLGSQLLATVDKKGPAGVEVEVVTSTRKRGSKS